MNQSNKPNKLINSTSPYLKQHAYNPVEWHPWGDEALEKARREDKPMIVSIGYSACHWCHVMERESFENQEIADVMNAGFVCIKVDREERPDIDQIYMEAIQTMGLNGGWPLNVFTLPDQKPFYGGTYFQPRQWLHILKSIIQGFKEQREQLEESAREFSKALSVTDSDKYGLENQEILISTKGLNQMVNSMKQHFDGKLGGLARAPKFPNPSIWKFLLIANTLLKDKQLQDQILLTLSKMAKGGIYDQIGGGFARYSVDERWIAPHFEKMLYDNGQLISLYAMAYQQTGNEQFKAVVYDSIEFVKRELTSPEYGFYSALDADSEGEEGNFYIWKSSEIDALLGANTELFKKYYHVESDGNWERGCNILYCDENLTEFAEKEGLDLSTLKQQFQADKEKLMAARSKRARPGLDDKILAGWNGMMLKGLVDAYNAFGERSFLDLALKNAVFIQDHMIQGDKLMRSFSQPDISGYLEDYALVIEAFYALHQSTFEDRWLTLAVNLADYTISNFYDTKEELFYFTDRNSETLIARKKEIFDNVIPASNSVMAQNLYWLGTLLENEKYLKISQQMLSKITPLMLTEAQYLTNWGTLYASMTKPVVEIAIIGEEHMKYSQEIQKHFIPNRIIAASNDSGSLPILQNRVAIDGKTTVYVCFNKSCKLPVHSVKEALELIEQ